MRVWSQRDVMAFLDRVEPVLGRMQHFELLDVAQTASDGDIQRAFHAMAGALHPDRHRALPPASLERLTIVYARIAEAYRVLREPTLRLAYQANLDRALGRAAAVTTPPPESPPPAPPSWLTGHRPVKTTTPPPAAAEDDDGLDEADHLARIGTKAQHLYRRAMAASQTGDRGSALLNLRMALAAHPTSRFLRQALTRLEGKVG